VSAQVVRRIVLKGTHGLHARPATTFVQTAQQFTSDISIVARDEEVDGKSIISILTLGLGKGAEIEIKAVGEDAEAALNALVSLIETNEAFA
jgi:phosphocarrier protein